MPPISTGPSSAGRGSVVVMPRPPVRLAAGRTRRRPDGLDDVHVARAAADVAADRPPHVVVRRSGVLLDQRRADQHHPGGAEAALEAVLLLEGSLDRVQLAVRLEPLDGRDLVAVGLDGEHGAGLDRAAVEQHGAGAAAGGVAPDVRTGQPDRAPDVVHQQDPRFDVLGVGRAVDGDGDCPCLLSSPGPGWLQWPALDGCRCGRPGASIPPCPARRSGDPPPPRPTRPRPRTTRRRGCGQRAGLRPR